MIANVTNVLNAKSLEKQLKLYDSRIQVLQEEMDELQRLRSACQLLLGQSPQETSAENAEASKASSAKRGKLALSARIFELLRERHEGLTPDAIFQELKSAGIPVEKEGEGAIESVLKKHPELFSLGEGDRWSGVEPAALEVVQPLN